jgi:hypothetical protein
LDDAYLVFLYFIKNIALLIVFALGAIGGQQHRIPLLLTLFSAPQHRESVSPRYNSALCDRRSPAWNAR